MIRIRWAAAFLIRFIETVSRIQARTALVICCLVAASCPAFAQFSIARPNYGVPEFAEPGGTFRVEVKASAGLTNTLWSAVLVNDLRSWTGVVEQVEYGSHVDNNTLVGYELKVRVPADISPEVFNLVISHPSGGAATNRNAVSIVPDLEANFYILHYADPQAEAYEPDNADTGMHGTHGSIREMYWHAPAMRLINPRFMFDTGDELDNVYGTSVARYQEYIDAMCHMGVPVLATRGNNDSVVTVADWRSTIGIETYSLTMGSFYVCQKDYNANDYTAWLTNDYAASFTNAAIKYRLFGQHFIVGGAGWMPPAGQYPGLMLVGHGHVNSTLLSSPYYIIETQQACNKGAVGFFEFARGSTNWTCTSLTNIPAAQFQVMSAGAVARIANTFAFTNNGSCSSNTATIVNQIPHDFWDGRVRFLMQYSAAGYSVSNGVKLAEYACNDNSNMAVVVKVNIAKSATTVVGIQPWATNFWLATAASNGQVDATNGWMSAGSSITVTAWPDVYYHFAYWSGDVPSSETNSNPLTLTMDRSRTIAATCAANQTTNGTPHWWLAKYALPTNDAGAHSDEGDGVPAWQEYVADTDPTNAASNFRITGATNLPPWTVYFDSSSNRTYTLSWCSNLADGTWSNVTGQESRKGVGGPDQMQDSNASPGQFYRLKVDLP
jgi:hypothetical protein